DNWTDDEWWMDQENRALIKNEGYWTINEGEAEGKILGGNLGTFNLLHGTQYMPDISDSVLFIEDDSESQTVHFDRQLQALIHQPGFDSVRGLVIGRFQKESQIQRDDLEDIIRTKKELDKIPVIANVDFGHTEPKITIPIGGQVYIKALSDSTKISFKNRN
ncbi:LD-carboxypeptidase, partial [Candidatus Dojkabacteria bacterium]|nr:LD-carboxypeptidase [Candidatus Dojkabacteria bacterium]